MKNEAEPNNLQTQKTPENTKPKNIQWNEREFLSDLHQAGCTREVIFTSRACGGGRGGGFVWRIVTFVLAAVTARGAQSFDASICHRGCSTACCLPSSHHHSPVEPAATFPPPLLHHGLCTPPKTSRKCAKKGNSRPALRALKKIIYSKLNTRENLRSQRFK